MRRNHTVSEYRDIDIHRMYLQLEVQRKAPIVNISCCSFACFYLPRIILHIKLVTACGFLGSASIKALLIEECAVFTVPREGLGTNAHVVRLRSVSFMGVLTKEDVLERRNNTDRDGNNERDFNPLPHLINLLLVRMARVLRLQLLLVSQTSSDLLQGVLLHGVLGTKTRDRCGRSTLQDSGSSARSSARSKLTCGNLKGTKKKYRNKVSEYAIAPN